MVRYTGVEPVTTRLKVVCSTIWANNAYGVNNGARTRDNQYHKLALYQLNYIHHMVCPKGFEPLAYALEGRCSIQLSYEHIYYKIFINKMVRYTGVEPVTTRLKVVCSTIWANNAWSGRRGSNSRHSAWKADALPTELLPQFLVAGEGFEPTTFGLWARRATRLLYPAICILF